MTQSSEIKRKVIEKYGLIANGGSSCCGDNALGFSMIGEDYKFVQGHVAEADLGLGCGVPTQFANIREGDHILDLGSGAGNDCFVARSLTGSKGRVVGIDFTESMVEKARLNNSKLGFDNVEFVQGDIESMPLTDSQFDVVISNCVLNLVPDKRKAYAEIMRVLKPGGHFCVSDVVLVGELPAKLRESAEMYVGCVAGALNRDAYMEIIVETGFSDVVIHKERLIEIPKHILENYLSQDELVDLIASGAGIYSLTVSGSKPEQI